VLLTAKKKKQNSTYTRNTKEKQKKHPSKLNNLHLGLVYALYDLRSGNGAGPILTSPEPTLGIGVEHNARRLKLIFVLLAIC